MIGFIGGGNMAEAMIRGMTAKGLRDIFVSEPRADRRLELEKAYRIKTSGSNADVVSASEIVVLAVKPQNMEAVLTEISPFVDDRKTIVSIAAGIPLSYLESRLKTEKLIRVMPNTPALVQEGMSVISLCGCSYGPELDMVKGILLSVGKVLTLPERMMDAVTALSGSGPAFVALFAEAMIASGQELGLSADDASVLTVQTLLGTAKMLDEGMPPERLRVMVTSPGGTTEAGLKVFEQRSLKSVVSGALLAAKNRAEELGRKE